MAFISYLQPFLDVNKRTGRLACNVPLLKNRLAPLSFLELDKEVYVGGLLAFYELDRAQNAYIQGYIATASRYDAYVGRDCATVDLEAQRRADIHGCVRAYIETSVSRECPLDIDAFARERFSAEPADVRHRLIERVAAIVSSLNDANHIAYGIARDMFDRYGRLPQPNGNS